MTSSNNKSVAYQSAKALAERLGVPLGKTWRSHGSTTEYWLSEVARLEELEPTSEDSSQVNTQPEPAQPEPALTLTEYGLAEELWKSVAYRTESSLGITKKLKDQNSPVVIAQDINDQGAKQFVGLSSHQDIFSYVEDHIGESFHEVMPGLGRRRLYFDFDKRASEGAFPSVPDFIHHTREAIVEAVDALFGATLDAEDILFAQSQGEKFSLHIHVPVFNTTVENLRILYAIVSGCLVATDPIFAKDNGESCLDGQVYKANQTLRLVGCTKKGKNNKLELLTSSCRLVDTLAGFLDESDELFLKPHLQKKIDARKAEAEEKRVAQLLNGGSTKHTPEFYQALCAGLAQKRADEYSYWNKVCLALGHENAGLDIAMEFSRRSSKFNEHSVQKAYEQGQRGFAGRPLTVGTLLSYLKEDNEVLFRRLLKTQASPANDTTFEAEHNYKEMIEAMGLGEEDPVQRRSDLGLDASIHEPDDSEDECIQDEEVKRTQEEKLKRWLDNAPYFLKHPVSEAVDALDDDDEVEVYSERYMQEYQSDSQTIVVKGRKGQGKTHQLVEYIKKHNPRKVVFVSFRRSFSKELLKRLSPLGFVDYRSLQGGIKDDTERVIIQVESLMRLQWHEKADLVVFDEIESIRGQLFSPTVKFKTAVTEKYAMLMRTAKQVFVMDADISENTVKHVKKTRSGIIHYIENEHKLIQADFAEFYTTKMDKIQVELCKALDAGEKIVMPMNRSVKFMEAMRSQIAEKYPEMKIQVYNSKTIRKKEVAAELNDVGENWKKYDVIMYSPTISAGVSFDEKHFDKCFCYFVNNGKVNSMRQMINRVRIFSSNEYYYCLQSFGGTSKPTDEDEFENYICSNRFLGDKPECILSLEDWDGTREYPMKDTGYWLWVWNEIEKNRDKNMFLYNFLREQYHSGVGQMNWIGAEQDLPDDLDLPDELEAEEEEEVPAPRITKDDVEQAKGRLNVVNNFDIADADPIDDAMKKDIEARMEKEEDIEDHELLSLQRKNLLDCYDLDIFTEISGPFVAIYGPGSMRKAYHNRKLLERPGGLDALMKEEGNQFNNLFGDHVSVQEDLAKKYKSMKFTVALEFIKIAGFTGLYSTQQLSGKKMLARFKQNEELLIKKLPAVCAVMGRSKRHYPKLEQWGDKVYLRNMLKFVNSITNELFCIKIKQTTRRSGKYAIDGIDQFSFTNR